MASNGVRYDPYGRPPDQQHYYVPGHHENPHCSQQYRAHHSYSGYRGGYYDNNHYVPHVQYATNPHAPHNAASIPQTQTHAPTQSMNNNNGVIVMVVGNGNHLQMHYDRPDPRAQLQKCELPRVDPTWFAEQIRAKLRAVRNDPCGLALKVARLVEFARVVAIPLEKMQGIKTAMKALSINHVNDTKQQQANNVVSECMAILRIEEWPGDKNKKLLEELAKVDKEFVQMADARLLKYCEQKSIGVDRISWKCIFGDTSVTRTELVMWVIGLGYDNEIIYLIDQLENDGQNWRSELLNHEDETTLSGCAEKLEIQLDSRLSSYVKTALTLATWVSTSTTN